MAKLNDILNKLKELFELKKNKEEYEYKLNSLDRPKSKDYHTNLNRSKAKSMSNEELGITLEELEEPKKPSFKEPKGKPEKKTPNMPYKFNYFWIYRSVRLVILTIISLFNLNNNSFLLFLGLYLFVWFFLWGLLGNIKGIDSFRFKGLYMGFVHLINLNKLPDCIKEKKEVDEYNSTTYVEESKAYSIKYEEAKREYENEKEKYQKELKEYKGRIEQINNERLRAIDLYVDSHEDEVNETIVKETKDYEEKSKDLKNSITDLEEKINSFGNIDDEIIFNPNVFSSSELSALINIIERGRASSLKEALNILDDDIRKNDEENQRQIEANRLEYETRRNNEEMERLASIKNEELRKQNEETRLHNQEMERINEKYLKEQSAYSQSQVNNLNAQSSTLARMLCNSCRWRHNCYYYITGKPLVDCKKYIAERQ